MVLLDTCALIWSVNRDPMEAGAEHAISRAAKSGALYLSPVSAWEIGLLVKRGRLRLDVPVEAYVAKAFGQPGVHVATLTPEIAVRSSFLPEEFHDDPADRLIVATAMIMGLKLITRDRRMLDYGAQGYLPVMAC